MSEPTASYAFLPWLRRGVSVHVRDARGADGRLQVPIGVAFGGDRVASVTVGLAGPGDVVGLDPRTVIRTWPGRGEREVEANYLPLVEFDQPDLPWRYSPSPPSATDRLRPWLCLIVLRDDEVASFVPASGSRAIPVVTTADAALPILDQSWAWAHVQVVGTTSVEPEEAADLLREAPQRLVSRLLCPRRLDAGTRYTAVVVPAFETGRRAGLGLPAGEEAGDPLAPAWVPGTSSVQLPVYFRWSFSTGPGGDFEALVKRLTPRKLAATVGVRDLDASDPGAGLPPAALAPMGLEGALIALDMASRPWRDGERGPFVDALRAFLNRPAALLQGAGGVRTVAPPLYGRWYAARDTLEAGAEPPWFQEVNSDPRWRAAAGAGSQVVQANQRQLLAAAWQQVKGLADVNDALRLAQLGRAVAVRVHERHLRTGDEERVLQLTAAVHGHVRDTVETVAARLRVSPIPDGILGSGWRRVTRSFGPRPAILARLNRGELSPAPLPATPSHMVTAERAGAKLVPGWATPDIIQQLEALSRRFTLTGAAAVAGAGLRTLLRRGWRAAEITRVLGGAALGGPARVRPLVQDLQMRVSVRDGKLTPGVVVAVPGRSTFVATQSEILEHGPAGPTVPGRPGEDSLSANAFRAATVALLDRDGAALPQPATLETVELGPLSKRVVEALDPVVTIGASVAQRLRVADHMSWNPKDPLEPVLAGPELSGPMYRPLAELSQDWLLPGLSDVATNTAALVTTNERFVEAYMLGLNHEMGGELLWQEFPTDQRRTYFRQFWDTGGFVPPPGQPFDADSLKDIGPIHLWESDAALGENSTRDQDQLVLLVRGDVVRLYPNVLVYVARAVRGDDDRREPGPEELQPRFSGRLEPDVAFFGFALTAEQARGRTTPDGGDLGWFFVLQERPGEPRFGLDVGDPGGDRPLAWNDLHWGHLVPSGSDFSALNYIDLDADLPDTRAIAEPAGVAWHADRGLGRSGARGSHLAFVTLQRPVRVAIHAANMLSG